MLKIAGIGLIIIVAGFFAWKSSFVLAATPGTHPDLDRQNVAKAAQILMRAIEQDESAEMLRASADTVALTLGPDHYATAMIRQTLANSPADSAQADSPAAEKSALLKSLRKIYESLTFRPLMEAKVPTGFPAFTPLHCVDVKSYPAYRMAKVGMNQPSEKRGNRAFFSLFNHIQRNEIAMTAPVQVDYSNADGTLEEASMAFLYGSTDLGAAGSDTKDARVEVVDVPAQTFVSIGVRGAMNEKAVMAAREQLLNWLKAHDGQYVATGAIRKMGYNSPFIPNSRRFFEVQIPVERVVATVEDKQPLSDVIQ